ncbi:hypothetical protein [Paenibacillus ihumii]|uniref:hypothetical protein n=1 Tax=Paenibacillus ihumii TaxID=687436 RepID=UPI0006D7B83D|nr:hypothetical protein [Paenibacillus ihumii]
MEEEQSFIYLIDYLGSYLSELELELQNNPDDLFLQGKIKGIQLSLKYIRMHEYKRNAGHYIDIEID